MAATVVVPCVAAAQEASPQALVAARELFREATTDVDAGRFDVALGKFRRVAAVKETAAVRFNIGRCEEQLGRLGSALGDYELAVREGTGDARAVEIGRLAEERATAVRPRVPRLTITPPPSPPADLVVKLDGAAQPPGALGVALPVDPGMHKVEATGGGSSFSKELGLRDGEAQSVAIELAPAPGGHGPAPLGDDHILPAPVDEPNRVPGYIALGVGGAFALTSIVFLLLHNQASSDLTTQKGLVCTLRGGACPESARATLDPLQSSSQRDAGLGIGFGVAAAVAVGIGVYLELKPPRKTPAGEAPKNEAPKTTTPSARLVPAPGGVMVVGSF